MSNKNAALPLSHSYRYPYRYQPLVPPTTANIITTPCYIHCTVMMSSFFTPVL